MKKSYKDRAKYLLAKKRERERYYGPSRGEKDMPRWTEEEKLKVLEFTGQMTDMEMSILLGRSVKAIQHVRSKLKKSGMAMPQYINGYGYHR